MSYRKREKEFKKILKSSPDYEVEAYEQGKSHICVRIREVKSDMTFKYFMPGTPSSGAGRKASIVLANIKKAADKQRQES